MKALIAVVCLIVLSACQSNTQSVPLITPKQRTVTLKGEPLTLPYWEVKVGQNAPDLVAVGLDMKEKSLSDYLGKTVVISSVPSIDTKVCSIQTRTFNEKAAALGDDVVILTISMDLPMAQKRFCAAEGIEQVVMLSDYRHWDFAEGWGMRIVETGLLARAIYIVDPAGKVVYREIVPELTSEPDYDAALKAAGQAAG